MSFLLRDTAFAQRTEGLIDPAYFANDINAAIVSICLDHYKTYKEAPRAAIGHIVKKAVVAKKIRADLIPDLKPTIKAALEAPLEGRELLIDEVSDFAKNRAIENAIMKSAELVGKKDYAKIQQIMGAALLVGSVSDAVSYDYWKEASSRTTIRKEILSGVRLRDGVTTGVEEFDKLLYHHGWGRKELAILMGAPKAGKSLALADFGKVASMAGKNVILFSCEVSARIIADRVDASVSDMIISLVGDNPIAVQAAVDAAAKTSGVYVIEEYASGTLKASEIRRVLNRYRTRGVNFDLIVVDYGDLMAPERHSDEIRENLRTIFIDLRAIAFENNAAMLTATQTNREGAKSAISKMTDVAE